MKRFTVPPRPDWQKKVESNGLIWHTGETPYWNETACYAFSGNDIEVLEKASTDLYQMFLEAGDYIINNKLFAKFGIPEWAEDLIIDAWNDSPPCLNYGRFDLGFDGKSPPKLFEFNCDTPTSLLEAAIIQWHWKEEMFPDNDQFNSIHDKLIEKWKDIAPYLNSDMVHFAHAEDAAGEDTITAAYLLDTATEAGLAGQPIFMGDIGWQDGCFYDLQDREIQNLYHLYPWEWIVSEPFGRNIAENENRTLWIEPIWKMMWSNKAVLSVLSEMYPNHPNLLTASFDTPTSGDYVRKPILAREGANISIVKNGKEEVASGGSYDDGNVIYQELYELPVFDNMHPVIGSWIVDGEPSGMGIREGGLITNNLAQFKPHIIE